MNTIVIALFVALSIGSSLAQDCSAKINAFHSCVESSRQQGEQGRKGKFDALKPQLDACFTSNGCTPPTKGANPTRGQRQGNNAQGGECRKALQQALKQKVDACIRQSVPSFVSPPVDKEEHHDKQDHERFDHKDDKELGACANKQAVRTCQRALLNSTRPSESEKRAQFQARCESKQRCEVSLGAACKAQLEQIKVAACSCRQQQHQQAEQIRVSIPACQSAQNQQGAHPARPQQQKQETCDNKNYCALGYDAFVADHQNERKGGRGGKGGNH